MSWTLVWEDDPVGDYYAGRDAALYQDDELVWSGASCGVAEDLVRALVADEALTVIDGGMRLPVAMWPTLGCWPKRLVDLEVVSRG